MTGSGKSIVLSQRNVSRNFGCSQGRSAGDSPDSMRPGKKTVICVKRPWQNSAPGWKHGNASHFSSLKMSQNTAMTASGAVSSGALKFSFAKGPVSARTPSKNSSTVFATQENSDSEDDTKVSRITHLEEGAAAVERTVKEEKAPLVIKPPESIKEHWLERRLKLYKPDAVDNNVSRDIDLSAIPDRIGNESVKAGLQIPQKPAPPRPNTPEEQAQEVIEEPNKTEEELSRELLIREAMNPNGSISSAPKLVIPAREPLSEKDVYAHDMAHLSDAPTLETYERVPVEAFGMGILLGLGWKEGTDLHGQSLEKLKEPKKRPDFLGIGAKEEEFLRTDAKGKKLSRKDGLGASWNPLKRVHKETGEVLVEVQSSQQTTVEVKYRRSEGKSRNGSRSGTPNSSRDERPRSRNDYSDSDRDRNRDRDRDHDRNRVEKIRKDEGYESTSRRKEHSSERRSRDSDYDDDRYRDRKRREDHNGRSRGRSRSRDRDYRRSQR